MQTLFFNKNNGNAVSHFLLVENKWIRKNNLETLTLFINCFKDITRLLNIKYWDESDVISSEDCQ